MTVPTQMNCKHIGDGWCLECVRKLSDKCDFFRQQTIDLTCDSGNWSKLLQENEKMEMEIELLKIERDSLIARLAAVDSTATLR